MKKIIFGITLLISSLAIQAAEVTKSEITYISPWTPHIDIQMSASFVSVGCGTPTDFYRIDLVNDDGAKEKYSTILAAFISGKEVGLSISGCVGDRPKIQGVRLYK